MASRQFSGYRDGPSHSMDMGDHYTDSIPPAHALSDLNARSPFADSSDRLGLPTSNPGPSPSSSAAAPSAYPIPTGGATQFQRLATSSNAELPYMPTRQYQDIENNNASETPYRSPWAEKAEQGSRRSKWIVIGSIVGIIGVIAVAVAVGVTVSKKHSSSSSSSSSGSSSGNAVQQTDPNDPSTFVKDNRLIQSFYGLAYTPEGSQLPDCGNSLSQVITDIQLLSQLTTRIRLYGADCNQTALVLEAIKQTKVNMTLFPAIYNIPTDPTPYTRQKALIQDALTTYGTDSIGGITVGNEFMLNYLSDNGGASLDPNGAVGNAGAALLIANITDMRNTLDTMGLTSIPVGTSDAGSYFNNKVLGAVAYGMANVHPWFANESATDAAGWTAEFFQDTDVAAAQALSNNPTMYIAETGWPTKSSDLGNANNGASDASEANLQIFLDDFVCQANANGTKYFFFEYFDEPWKDAQFGGVEGWWGLFNSNRTLKNINIPDCTNSTSTTS